MLPSVMSFGGAKTFGFLILLCASLACCSDKTEYQTGTLLDINHHDSSRMIGNSQNGSVQSVTDREYEISVRVGNMTYVGSYWPRWRWSYEPTDMTINSDIKVRLTKKEMYILRDDGKEVRTKIIKRIVERP